MKPDQDIPDSSALAPINLLLVEDNPGDARLVYEMLRNQLHIKLEVADCLAACMLRLDQGGIDLVLLDLGLCDSQGLDTITSVAQAYPAQPIVALTGLDDDALALRTVQAGGQDYLTKNTVTPEILRRTIRHAIERKHAEENLVKSKNLLSETEKTGKIGGWEFDAEKLTQSWTEETFHILEIDLTKGEPKVPEGLDFIAPAFRPIAEQAIRSAIEFGEPYDQEWEIITMKGNRRWVHAVAKAYQEQGKTKRVSGSFQDITERKRAEIALRESEEKFRVMVETIPLAIYLSVGIEQISEYLNPEFIKLFGYTQKDIPTIEKWWPLAYPDETYRREISEEWTQRVKCALETQLPIEPMEVVVTCKDGSKKNISWGYVTMGEKNYACGLDLTERKRADEKVIKSLEEKEILLKEVHHRVKNNLMTIIGLIKMQETKANNKIFDSLLQELEGRIRAMALVHESLYKSADLAHIDLQNYIETMSAQIRSQFGAERDIRFRVQAAELEADLDTAVPCGLILNELITNALKHAFPGGRSHAGKGNCEITVTVKQDESACMLTVADNGVGLPAGLDWEKSETLGLRLVRMLGQQINGSLDLDRTQGTAFRLRLKPMPQGR